MSFSLNNFKNEKIHSICIFCYNLKVYCNLPRMHTHNDIPSTACHFQWFLYTRISQAHISFRFAVVCKPLRVFYLYQKPIGFWFVLNDSVIQGSLSNHSSNTTATSGVKLTCNVKKNLLLVVSSVENLQKVKNKGILLGKLIFLSSTSVIVILPRLVALTCKNCSFQL